MSWMEETGPIQDVSTYGVSKGLSEDWYSDTGSRGEIKKGNFWDVIDNPLYEVAAGAAGYDWDEWLEEAKGKVGTGPDDGTTRVPTEIDLNDVKVEVGENHTNKIQLTDDVQLIMTYPKIYTIQDINPDNSYDIVTKCVHQITEGDKIHEKTDMSDADLMEFIESMNTDNLNDILDFFDTMPKIKYQIKVMNPNTNVENTINMEGIESFFT